MRIMTLTMSKWNLIKDICEAHKQCKRCMKLQIVILQEEIQKLRKKEEQQNDCFKGN